MAAPAAFSGLRTPASSSGPLRRCTDRAKGDLFRAGAAAGYELGARGTVQLGAELFGHFVLAEASSRTSGLELLAGAKWRFVDDFQAGLAALQTGLPAAQA